MPDILIRGLDEQTVNRLKDRAKQNGRSLQSEVKEVLQTAATASSVSEMIEAGRQMRKKLGQRFGDSTELIREDRQR